MRYIKYLALIFAIISITIALILSSMIIYPFFEIGFTSIANEYQNSKIYILSMILDNSGTLSGLEIVGMDLTSQNILVVDVPADLTIENKTLSSIYVNYGASGVENAIGQETKLKFTDQITAMKNTIETYDKSSKYTITDVLKTLENKTQNEDLFEMLEAFNEFSTYFKSTIDLPKFIRITKFLRSNPSMAVISYPSKTSNGLIFTDKAELKNFSIEMENCLPIHNPFSIKPLIINCTDISSSTFYQNNWRKWSKYGYNFNLISSPCTVLSGQNIVLAISNADWKSLAIKKALEGIYPGDKFKFLSIDSTDALKIYYRVNYWASKNRYYEIGNNDFIILLGSYNP